MTSVGLGNTPGFTVDPPTKMIKKNVLRPFGGPRNIICGQIIKQNLGNKATGNDFTSRDPTVAS